jgi:CRISPR-associated Csx10 family RAMP protein
MGVDWQRIGVTIHLKSSLHLGQAPQSAGEYLFTQRCIPGAALRGALAGTMIRNGMDPNGEAFKALFEAPGALRFEPAYPVIGAGYSFPFPLTARTCKLKGGFPLEKSLTEREKHHGVFDTLAAQFVFEQMLDEGKPVPFIYRPLCPRCGGAVEGATGCYGWSRGGNPLPIGNMDIVRTTHTAINRARGVAEDGMLYTIEAIPAGTTFWGTLWVRCESDEIKQVKAALTRITRLGRGTSRGRGRVEVTPHFPPPRLASLEERIRALTGCIEQEREFYHTVAGLDYEPDGAHYSTLDLLSPAILGDGVTADLRLPPKRLELPEGVKLVRRWVAPEHVGGWWTVAGLPHPTALAAAAGSVYLYRARPEVKLDTLAGRLREMQAEGIGQERERGYGAVLPCAPFHTWTEEKQREKTR